MLQKFLSDRFAVKTHMTSREFNAFELVIAKSGLKIHEARDGDPPPERPPAGFGPEWPDLPKGRPASAATVFFRDGYLVSRVRVQLEPLSILARLLPREDRLPVVDKTGLQGNYTFDLQYASPSGPEDTANPEPAPPIFDALRSSLGLELIRTKLPFDVVVVDSITTAPTDN